MGWQRRYEAGGITAGTRREWDRRPDEYLASFVQNAWDAMRRHMGRWREFVRMSATCWRRVDGGIGLRDDAIVSPRRDGDTGLAAVYRLDGFCRAEVRLVATILANVSARFGVDRTRNGRDIRR